MREREKPTGKHPGIPPTMRAKTRLPPRISSLANSAPRGHHAAMAGTVKDATANSHAGQLARLLQVQEELRQAKEDAEESARVKSAFLALISHELRTPLHQIAGLSAMIQEEAPGEPVREYAAMIRRCANDFRAMIDDLFDLAVAEHARLQIRPEIFRFDDIFRRNCDCLAEILRTSGRGRELELVHLPDAALAGTSWRGDLPKINRVLDNFFKNAVKFSDPGQIVFGCRKLGDRGLGFFVRDNGPGIPEGKRQIVFDLFRQADDSPTRRHGGMGIGLAICKKFADAIDAELICEPGPQRGTTFHLNVPLEPWIPSSASPRATFFSPPP